MAITVLSQIKNNYHRLSEAEQQVINYCLNTKMIDLKLQMIEQEVHVSAPTIMRAINKIGYTSFTVFKHELAFADSSANDYAPYESVEEIILNIQNDTQKTTANIDPNELNDIVKNILSAHRCFIIGVGSSSGIAKFFSKKIQQSGIWSNAFTEHSPISNIPFIANENDYILIFSLGGHEDYVTEAIFSSAIKNVKSGLISGNSDSELFQICNNSLVASQSTPKRKRLRSRLQLEVIADILFETLLLKINTRYRLG